MLSNRAFVGGIWGESFPGDELTTNMADEKRKSSSLRNLLETVYDVHRKDIKTHTSGHLNSSKLLKPPDQRHTKWKTSEKPPIRYVHASLYDKKYRLYYDVLPKVK